MNEAPSIDKEDLTPAQKGAITKAKNAKIKEADEPAKPVSLRKRYKNKTSHNIFTEAGRCRPKAVIELTTEQADQYAGLEACQD